LLLRLRQYGALFGRRVVLADVTCDFPATGIDVLMGPVRAGKSTLFRSLAGANDANPLFRRWGSAELDGRPIVPDNLPLLVQQHSTVLMGSVRDAIVTRVRNEQVRSVRSWDAFAAETLKSFHLTELTSQLDEPVFALAPHLQRAVNILRFAVASPKLLLIDEPTFGLNERSSDYLIHWLRELGARLKLVVSLHHQGQARYLADRIILIGGGYVVSHATTADFFSSRSDELVRQFIRTGSLSLPAPDAVVEDLASDVSPPRPLLPAALDALASIPKEPAVANRPESRPAAISPRPARPVPLATVVSNPGHPAALPAPSRFGVEEASTVGLVTLTDHSGPRGFSWIIPGKLAGCPEPGITAPLDYDLGLLRKTGVTCLITLTEYDLNQTALQRHGLSNLHLPIFDREAPTINQAYMLLIRMQKLVEQGQVLAVHCKAGLGRTGTIVAAWLIREGGLSSATAIARVRMINRGFVQSAAQEAFLEALELDLVNRIR